MSLKGRLWRGVTGRVWQNGRLGKSKHIGRPFVRLSSRNHQWIPARRYMSTNQIPKSDWTFNDSFEMFEKALKAGTALKDFCNFVWNKMKQPLIINRSEHQGKLLYPFNMSQIDKDYIMVEIFCGVLYVKGKDFTCAAKDRNYVLKLPPGDYTHATVDPILMPNGVLMVAITGFGPARRSFRARPGTLDDLGQKWW